MEKLSLELPAMYGDHHVTEVRRILLELPGVEDVYASSGFQVVELIYDAGQLDADTIMARLEEAGYTEMPDIPVETGVAAYEPGKPNGQQAFFRHTAAYQQIGHVVSFAQNVAYAGRPLWPCPGMGPIAHVEE